MSKAIHILILACSLAHTTNTQALACFEADSRYVSTEDFNSEIKQFLNRELGAHIRAISSLSPPPDRVLGAGTTGEYTWGTFMRALGAYAEMSGERNVGGRDLARLAG